MRLGVKLLNVGASANSFKQVDLIRVQRGETLDVVFQLVDLDQDGLRYMPAAGATVQVQILRQISILPADRNQRVTTDPTIDRPADVAFAGDTSIYKLPLIAADTMALVSNSIRVVLTEGSNVKIATLSQAIKCIDTQEF